MYVCHTLIAWVHFLWSHPQTTSPVVVVRPGSNRRVKKIMQEPKWSRNTPSVIVLESKNGNTASEGSMKAKESFSSSVTMILPQHVFLHLETPTTLHSLPETLQMNALPSSRPCPQYLVPTRYNGYLLAYFRLYFCTRHTLHTRIPSTMLFLSLHPCYGSHLKTNSIDISSVL